MEKKIGDFESKTSSKEHIPGDSIPLEELAEAISIVKDGKKILTLPKFRDKENVKIIISHPTVGIDTTSAEEYAKTVNKLLRDPNSNILTKKKMEELLKEKGLWTSKDEDQLEDQMNKMNQILIEIARMRFEKTNEELKDKFIQLRAEWYKERNKFIEMQTQKQSYFEQTIEGRGEEARLKLNLTYCVKFEDGTYVWNTIESLNNDEDRQNVMRIFKEAIWFWNGISQEVLDDLPEKVFNLFQGGATEKNSTKPNVEVKNNGSGK